jgi:hypothetical protein
VFNDAVPLVAPHLQKFYKATIIGCNKYVINWLLLALYVYFSIFFNWVVK